jgi:hypothetical protein
MRAASCGRAIIARLARVVHLAIDRPAGGARRVAGVCEGIAGKAARAIVVFFTATEFGHFGGVGNAFPIGRSELAQNALVVVAAWLIRSIAGAAFTIGAAIAALVARGVASVLGRRAIRIRVTAALIGTANQQALARTRAAALACCDAFAIVTATAIAVSGRGATGAATRCAVVLAGVGSWAVGFSCTLTLTASTSITLTSTGGAVGARVAAVGVRSSDDAAVEGRRTAAAIAAIGCRVVAVGRTCAIGAAGKAIGAAVRGDAGSGFAAAAVTEVGRVAAAHCARSGCSAGLAARTIGGCLATAHTARQAHRTFRISRALRRVGAATGAAVEAGRPGRAGAAVNARTARAASRIAVAALTLTTATAAVIASIACRAAIRAESAGAGGQAGTIRRRCTRRCLAAAGDAHFPGGTALGAGLAANFDAHPTAARL